MLSVTGTTVQLSLFTDEPSHTVDWSAGQAWVRLCVTWSGDTGLWSVWRNKQRLVQGQQYGQGYSLDRYKKMLLEQYTVKSFNFMDTNFCGLNMMDMFVDTCIREFQIIHNITKVRK